MAKKRKRREVEEEWRDLTFHGRRLWAVMFALATLPGGASLILTVLEPPPNLGIIEVVLKVALGLTVVVFALQAWFLATRPLFKLDRGTLHIQYSVVLKQLRYGEIDEVVPRGAASAYLRVRGADLRLPIGFLAAADRSRLLEEIQKGRERAWDDS